MDIRRVIILLGGLLVLAVWFTIIPMMMASPSMPSVEAGAPLRVGLKDPALEDPRLEAIRQVETFNAIVSHFGLCMVENRDADEDTLKEFREAMYSYRKNNDDARKAYMRIQYAEPAAGGIQQTQRDLQAVRGDGFFAHLKRSVIVLVRRGDMIDDVKRQISGPEVEIETGFPETPTYAECYRFSRKVAYGNYDLEMPEVPVENGA